MHDRISIETIPNVPYITEGDDVGEVLAESVRTSRDFDLEQNDIICVASKAVSMAEGRIVDLGTVTPGPAAYELQRHIPRKDPRTLQLIIDETGAPDLTRIQRDNNYIAGWLPNGYRLTSSGVDKVDSEHVILLPENPDESARRIGQKIFDMLGVQVAVVVTDSDGRVEKAGSTQVAIGLYGLPGLRRSQSREADGKTKTAEETVSDLVAAAAALLMGQRGTNKPAVVVRGLDYQFDRSSQIRDALSRPE